LRERPLSTTANLNLRPRDAAPDALDVTPRLNAIDQKALNIAQKFVRQAASDGQGKLTYDDCVLMDAALAFEVAPEPLFRGPSPSATNSDPPSFTNVDDLVSRRRDV
jgi:hypothetical protein